MNGQQQQRSKNQQRRPQRLIQQQFNKAAVVESSYRWRKKFGGLMIVMFGCFVWLIVSFLMIAVPQESPQNLHQLQSGSSSSSSSSQQLWKQQHEKTSWSVATAAAAAKSVGTNNWRTNSSRTTSIFQANTTRATSKWLHLVHNPNRSIVHIHIGKCGGTAVDSVLHRRQCLGKTAYWQQPYIHHQCVNMHHPLLQETNHTTSNKKQEETQLSIHTIGVAHLYTVPQKRPLQDFDSFLFTVRHPVDRVLSSYQFLHYKNANRSVLAQSRHAQKDLFYLSCFPNLQDFVHGIRPPLSQQNNDTSPSFYNESSSSSSSSSSTTTTTTTMNSRASSSSSWSQCQRLALETLLDASPSVGHWINIHMKYGFQYYYQQTIGKLLDRQVRGGVHSHPLTRENKEIFVIRSTHLYTDLRKLDKNLGGTGKFPSSLRSYQQKQQQQRKDTTLQRPSKQDYFYFCCLLYQEMQIYQELILQADNLYANEKEHSLEQLYESCHHTTASDAPNSANPFQIWDWQKWHQQNCPVWVNLPSQTWTTALH